MEFYKYTFKKLSYSVSTWITLVIALVPTWGLAIATIVHGADFTNLFSVVAALTVTLPIIFMSYIIIGIFRSEIENKTFLVLQSKPILKSSMIWQAILIICTMIFIFIGAGYLIPALAMSIQTPKMILVALLASIATFIILFIISVAGLRLSISFGSKGLVGFMLGVFGIGFYILFLITAGLSFALSRTTATNSIFSNYRNEPNEIKVEQKDDKIVFTVHDKTTAEEIYNDAVDAGKLKANNFIEWINPSAQWLKMYGALNDIESIEGDGIGEISVSQSIFTIFKGEDSIPVHITRPKQDDSGWYVVTFDITKKQTMPTWYPFVFWILLSGGFAYLTFRSLKKTNIS